MNLIAQIN